MLFRSPLTYPLPRRLQRSADGGTSASRHCATVASGRRSAERQRQGFDINRTNGMRAGLGTAAMSGAHIRDRTGDLSLTKTVLYLLSYVGMRPTLPECNLMARPTARTSPHGTPRATALPEPVKGLEPITGGLQNRCSTLELHRQHHQYRHALSRRSMGSPNASIAIGLTHIWALSALLGIEAPLGFQKRSKREMTALCARRKGDDPNGDRDV